MQSQFHKHVSQKTCKIISYLKYTILNEGLEATTFLINLPSVSFIRKDILSIGLCFLSTINLYIN